jgi:hypothetical protein
VRVLYELLRVRYYCRKITVGRDEIALLDLPSLRILVVPRSYESVVPKVTAYVSRDDFSIDAIFGNEVLIRTSRGSLRASISLSFSIPSRHGEKI